MCNKVAGEETEDTDPGQVDLEQTELEPIPPCPTRHNMPKCCSLGKTNFFFNWYLNHGQQ